MDKYCPMKELRVTADHPPFLTDDLLCLVRERDRAYAVARGTDVTEGWAMARALQSQIQSHLVRAKKTYIADEMGQMEKAQFSGKTSENSS